MTKLDQLKKLYDIANNPNQESLALSMQDTHHKGLFSLVIGGKEFGKLTRVFMADKPIKPYEVQLHTHRYPIKLTTIKGSIRHYVGNEEFTVDASTVQLSKFEYKSPLNGGNGLKYLKETNVSLRDYNLPTGVHLFMDTKEFHTVSCKKGAIWVVEEQGFETESSLVLGVPFILDDLYKQPASFQINDKLQVFKSELKKLILSYEAVSM